METLRKPFQGVINIIQFNWHFYVLSAAIVLLIFGIGTSGLVDIPYPYYIILMVVMPTIISLLVSFYVYDVSGLYQLKWLDDFKPKKIVTVHAGLDETSALLQMKFPQSKLAVFDFYDPLRHTEISIQRARKKYPSYPGTQTICTDYLPLPDHNADLILLTMAAHEIRNDAERILFFKELKRVLSPDGEIVVTEHLRDFPNFFAYNVGFFHFLAKGSWYNTFKSAGLTVSKEVKHTPFITTFILEQA